MSRIEYDKADDNANAEDSEKIVFLLDRTEHNPDVRSHRPKPRLALNIEWHTDIHTEYLRSTPTETHTTHYCTDGMGSVHPNLTSLPNRSCEPPQNNAAAEAAGVHIHTLSSTATSHEFVNKLHTGNLNALDSDQNASSVEQHEILFQQYDIKTLQRECTDFAQIIDYKETGKLPESKFAAKQLLLQADNFFLNAAGVLYHIQCIRNKRFSEYLPSASQVCVPKCLREIVLHQMHDQSCHCGFEKAYTTARQRFWWKSMPEDLNLHIKSCGICIRCKPQYNKKKVPQTNIEIPGFMQAWSFDHVGPLPETDGPIKYRYILTATEQLSLYTELFPVETCSASETAEKVYELICRWGVFSRVQFDRGSAFVSKVMTELMRLLSVRTMFSSPSHPQSNGKLERFHSTLGVALRSYAAGNKTNWQKLNKST